MLRRCSSLAPQRLARLARQDAVAHKDSRQGPRAPSAGNAVAAHQTDPADEALDRTVPEARVAPAHRARHEAASVIPELPISRFFLDAGGFEVRTR